MMRNRSDISSIALRAVCCFLLCGTLIATMSGCTAKRTDETIIRESVADVLGNFRSTDSDMTKRFISEMDIKELGSVGLNTTDFMKAYSDGFDYEISDIRVDGKSAEADIVIYVKSFSEFEKRFAAEIETISKKYEVVDQEDAEDPESPDGADGTAGSDAVSSVSTTSGQYGNEAAATSEPSPSKIKVTTAEMNSMFTRTIINCMKDTPVKEMKTVTVQFINSDNTWRPSPTAMDEILTAMIEN